MATSDILSDDEVETLLDKDEQQTVADGEIHAYDFSQLSGKTFNDFSKLEVVNEVFQKEVSAKLNQFLCQKVYFKLSQPEMINHGEYINSLSKPSLINMLEMKPLPGIVLLSFSQEMISNMVEILFGGNVEYTEANERIFGQVELSIGELLLEIVISSLEKSWQLMKEIDFHVIKSVINPNLANTASDDSNILVNNYDIIIDQVHSKFSLAIPYKTLKPLKHLIEAKNQDEEKDAEKNIWQRKLRNSLDGVEIPLTSTLSGRRMKISELMKLKAGDIIPIDHPKQAKVYSGNNLLYTGQCGSINGNRAVKVTDKIRE